MIRTCARCNFVNEQADAGAAAACPKCGVIYAKAAVASAQQSIGRKAAAEAKNAFSLWSFFEGVAWLMTITGACLGLVQLVLTWSDSASAPQQAAGAGMAIASAVIPYCLARALQQGTKRP